MENRKRKRVIHHKSAIPVYGAALVFLLWGLFSPIYKLWAIALAAVTSAGAYLGLKRVFPGRDETVTEVLLTGDPELDAEITKGRETLARFREAAARAGDGELQEKLSRIAAAGEAITEEIVRDPKDRAAANTFYGYYLPALDKLLSYYVSFLSAGQGENVMEGRRRIENSLGMVAEAFEKQLDRMYKNEAMDVKTDLALMETMLRMDGLTDKPQKQTSAGKGGNNV